MTTADFGSKFSEFWKEFVKSKIGLAGLIILLIFVVLSFIGSLFVPFPGATTRWRDIQFWQDNPQAAPPVWTNWFTSKKGVVSSLLTAKSEESTQEGIKLVTFNFSYAYNSDLPPKDLVIRFRGSGQVPLLLSMKRPDGSLAELYREQFDLATNSLSRISVARNCVPGTISFIRDRNPNFGSTLDPGLVNPMSLLFSNSDLLANGYTSLKGNYTFILTGLLLTENSMLQEANVVVAGHVSGILGTDLSKRDIFTGVIIGIRWALILGILCSLITVIIGVSFGIIAAVFGGIVDWFLSRLYEIVYLMPILPFLIVTSAIFKPSIWTLILMICIFFWAGVFKPVYSMAIQIKEEAYIEASRALGSSTWRIIFKHIFPILLPYSFASMALSIPGIIVYEASISLLGLGDATKVTWGQILHDALRNGAVINQLWWWVVPPGLTIALLGASFAFLGTALDKILHPKLKVR